MQKPFAVELVFVLILVVRTGESLKCFVCRSDTDTGCNGKMNESLSQECAANKSGPGVFCRKIHQKLRFRDEDSWTSIRECAYEKGKKACYMFKWVEIAYQETCECSQDNCNSGGRRRASAVAVAAAVSAWMFSYLKSDHT